MGDRGSWRRRFLDAFGLPITRLNGTVASTQLSAAARPEVRPQWIIVVELAVLVVLGFAIAPQVIEIRTLLQILLNEVRTLKAKD